MLKLPLNGRQNPFSNVSEDRGIDVNFGAKAFRPEQHGEAGLFIHLVTSA